MSDYDARTRKWSSKGGFPRWEDTGETVRNPIDAHNQAIDIMQEQIDRLTARLEWPEVLKELDK